MFNLVFFRGEKEKGIMQFIIGTVKLFVYMHIYSYIFVKNSKLSAKCFSTCKRILHNEVEGPHRSGSGKHFEES